MADDDRKPIVWFLENMERRDLAGWIFAQMSVGAGYAAIVVAAGIIFILLFVALARVLPEDPNASLAPFLGAAGLA